MLVIGNDDSGTAGLDKVREQPELGGEISLQCRVVIEMIAAEVGETACCDPHAVEAMLIKSMGRSFDGQMTHAFARELIERYPEVHDGYDRLGMVYEARGDPKAAADCYRKVIEFVQAHPDQYEPTFIVTFEQLIDELDPPSAT